MSILDVFRNDAFSELELTTFVDRKPYRPSLLGSLGIFENVPIRTTAMAIEDRQGKLIIVPTSARGGIPTERVTEKRKMRYFAVPRLAHEDTLLASELQNVRAFGNETVLMQMQDEVTRRLQGPTGLQANMELTWERHRLGAIQGTLLDADNSVLFNWFNEFGITQPAEIAFNLAANTPGSLRTPCNNIVRAMKRAAQGAFVEGRSKVMALAGDAFWDAFLTHVDVEKTYLNYQGAAALRGGNAFAGTDSADQGFPDAFYFGGIYWINYRGTDDNSTLAVAPDRVKFFPVDAPGIFQCAWAPGESFDWVNTPGKPLYILPIMDELRRQWFKMEAYSYPLHICIRPEVLQSGRAGK